MARYVVLSFDEDKLANTFVDDWEDALEGMKERGEEGWPRVLTPVQENAIPAEIIAMTIKPTMFCDSGDGHRGKKTDSGWTKGKKWGLWICGKCMKPSRRWGSSYKAVIGSAKNLLDENEINPMKLTDQDRARIAAGHSIAADPPPEGTVT